MSDDNFKPFKVLIINDYGRSGEAGEFRAEDTYTARTGICLGYFDPDESDERPYPTKRVSEENGKYAIPLILIREEEKFVWGYECDWTESEGLEELPPELIQDACRIYRQLTGLDISGNFSQN